MLLRRIVPMAMRPRTAITDPIPRTSAVPPLEAGVAVGFVFGLVKVLVTIVALLDVSVLMELVIVETWDGTGD